MAGNSSDFLHEYVYTDHKGWIPVCFNLHTEVESGFEKHMDHVAFTGFLSSSLSILGTISVIAFCCWRRACWREEIKPLLHLSVADLFLAVLWISGSVAYFANKEANSGHAYRAMAKKCFIWQLITELTHLVTFFLTINYSVNVYMQMKDRTLRIYQIPTTTDYREDIVDNSKLRRWIRRTLYIVSWILPILLLFPIVVHVEDKYICPCQRCVILLDVPRLEGDLPLLVKNYGYSVFTFVLSFSIASIVVLYALTLRLYWPTVQGFHTDRERRQLANMQFRITLYIVSFLVCWSPALTISCLKLSESPKIEDRMRKDLDKYFFLFILQALFAPLQGFLNSIVYGWSRKAFRNLPRESAERPLSRTSQTPYFSYSPLPSPVNGIEDSREVLQESQLERSCTTPLPM